ncbi:hypothetical protein D0Z70_03450 [Sphingobium terrigena]|uniref:RiboL-PSP-HEPN domain-containing protein n=1 Tax=Sphingobium terrigena TaxID=2304063 RepID=A0A418YXH2_9SPHN|nr:hypothetical protein [Sphingobium terrigena]RJG57274.1 hypothetical protein D0Z70_03450 [Sphingobium terrigena]
MASIEYRSLTQSISELEGDLLNFEVKVVDPYSTEELLKCQAYVIFSHAEIQVYWEKVARRILREAEYRWHSSNSIDRVIASLLAFRRTERVAIPENPSQPSANADLAKLIEYAIAKQKEAIDGNNGIKSANLANLLCPLGMMKDNFSPTFLIQSDQTGRKRGDLVHKSSSVSMRTIRDPFSDEKSDIDKLLAEIELVDGSLERMGLLSVSVVSPAVPNSLNPVEAE